LSWESLKLSSKLVIDNPADDTPLLIIAMGDDDKNSAIDQDSSLIPPGLQETKDRPPSIDMEMEDVSPKDETMAKSGDLPDSKGGDM